jgi:hypothetical protein
MPTPEQTETKEVAADLAEDLDAWRSGFARRMDTFEAKLNTNTEATTRIERNTGELVDILQSWKGAMKVIDFLGKLAKPLTAALGLLTAWWAWKGGK